MPSRFAAAVAAAVLLAGPAAVAASASSTPAPALLRALPGALPLQLRGALDLGAAPATAVQQVDLVLALRDQAGLTRLLRDQQTPGSADYQHWLTPAQFADRFAPSSTVVAAARRWAQAAGLTVTAVSSNRTLVTLEGTRAQLNRAFGVQLRSMRLGSQQFVMPDRAASLPSALRAATASVLGLTTYNPNHVATPPGYKTYGTDGYGPHDFETVYHSPAASAGTGQTVAVITQGYLGGVAHDLRVFEDRFQLPHVPFVVVDTTAPSKDTSGATEYDLDTQYATGFAPRVKRLIAYNGSTLASIHPLNQFVVERRSRTASASYGGCEAINWAVGNVDADDQVFKQAVAQGQTFWVSTGDEGSSCSILINTGTPLGVPDVEYPSSSPYVVAVGGTTLTGSTTQPTREIAWVGGGGGYSNVESAPSWQKAAGLFQPAVGRGLPDVSLDADPNSGFTVIVDGQPQIIGGTSASTPAWNGIWTRVLQRHPRVGFAAPALYRLPAGTLTDITVGSNGLWSATSGYDLATGLGTPDITKLVSAIR